MATVYCREWNTLTDAPREPMTEAVARRRFEQGPWFTVVLDAEGGVPRATIELQPGASVAKVFRYADGGSVEQVETYRQVDGRLFLMQLDTWEYPDDGKHTYGDARIIDTFLFKPDGVVRRVLNDKSEPGLAVEERSGVDVGGHWLPVPEFGDWEPLLERGDG